MKFERFSVAMSVYFNDKPEDVRIAFDSILERQTVKPSEIFLVIDGPISPALDAVILEYESRYPSLFTLLRLEQNGGLGRALALAVEGCRYPMIARMDSDDIALPDRFEQQLRYFRANPEVDIVGGDINEFLSTTGKMVGRRAVPRSDVWIKRYMKKRCAMNHMSVMFRREAVLQAGNYIDFFWNEDYYLWIRMMRRGCVFANTGTVLMNVRVGPEMYRRRGGKRYWESEKRLQKYMLNRHIIGPWRYLLNVSQRFIVQRVLPDCIRGWVFRVFARKRVRASDRMEQ